MKTKHSYSKIIEFADHKVGLYDLKTFSKDWDNARTDKGEVPRGIGEGRGSIVKIKGEKVLQIVIPKSSISDGGSFWRLKLPKVLTDVTFEYDIMFGNNCDILRPLKVFCFAKNPPSAEDGVLTTNDATSDSSHMQELSQNHFHIPHKNTPRSKNALSDISFLGLDRF